MPHYILDKAYTVNQSGGVAAHRAVVHASEANACTLPSGPGDGPALGVTVTGQSETGRAVAVRKAGIALVEAAAPITVGDAVEIADTAGRVRAIAIGAGETTWCLGFAETAAAIAGDLVEVFLSPHRYTIPFAA